MLTPKQERQELLDWIRRAVADFDSRAEGYPGTDPSALFSEGKVCLMRLEHEPER